MNSQDVFKIVEAFGKATEVRKFKADIVREKNTQWGKLWKFAVDEVQQGNIKTGNDFIMALRPGENLYMDTYFQEVPDAKWEKDTPKHKKGDWKLSLLPAEYTTSRDLIKRAIDTGDLLQLNNQNTTGKSAVQAALPRKNTPRNVSQQLSRLAYQANKLHQFTFGNQWQDFLRKLDA